jgi:quinol monooxygenase YgiN
MIQLLSKFPCKNGEAAAELLKLLDELKVSTPKEQGCVQYNIFSDQADPLLFYIIELWETERDLKVHEDRIAVEGYLDKCAELLLRNIETKSLIKI